MLNQFPRLLTLLRQEKDISQKQAAQDLGVSQALLSHYEKGIRECGLDFVVKAADYYKVSADYLLGRSPDRQGAVIHAEELPDEAASGKENVYKGSLLPTLNKRLLFNSLNILFDLLQRVKNKELINEVSSDIMLSVYRCFRYVYSINKDNPDTLFAAENACFSELAFSAQQLSAMKIKCLTGSANSKKIRCAEIEKGSLTLNQKELEKQYPLFASSLMNLIQNCEIKMNARKK